MLTETDFDNIDVKSPLENRIQQQEREDSVWRFDKNNSIIVSFFKTGETNGSSYVKILLRLNALLNFDKDDKYCFVWLILAKLHPCKNTHPNRLTNYKQYSTELNLEGFNLVNGFKSSDVHIFGKINNLSKNIFELIFYQGQN